MLAIAQVTIMTGRPRLIHITEVMGVRVFSDSVATMMFALEPMIVPVPPTVRISSSILRISNRFHAGRTLPVPAGQ